MKLITKTLLILYLLLIPAQSETNKLVVYTYDSFVAEWGPGPLLEEKFEEFCMCDLQFVGLSDGVEILTRVMYEGPNTDADIVLGLDSNLTHKAKMTGFFMILGIFLSFIILQKFKTRPPALMNYLIVK